MELEGENIIAKFMGGKYSVKNTPYGKIEGHWFDWNNHPKPWVTMLQESHFIYNSKLYYDKSWDWLMPVAQKIFQSEKFVKSPKFFFTLEKAILGFNIEDAHKCIVEYLKSPASPAGTHVEEDPELIPLKEHKEGTVRVRFPNESFYTEIESFNTSAFKMESEFDTCVFGWWNGVMVSIVKEDYNKF